MSDPSSSSIRIGSRSSDLALWQAYEVVRLLRGASEKNVTFPIHTELSSGDVSLSVSLSSLAAASPGVFTKELEVALIARRVDLAVHSLKDVPTSLPEGLVISGIPARADARDAVVISAVHTATGVIHGLSDLPDGAIVGTSSLRREAFLRRNYPTLVPLLIRGNLNTRLRKLDAASPLTKAYDALLLARAGLTRLGWTDRATVPISAVDCPYGVGQGALCIETRGDDQVACALARKVTHAPTALRVFAERAFLRAMQGGCQVPLGVESRLDTGLTAEGGVGRGRGGGGALPTSLDHNSSTDNDDDDVEAIDENANAKEGVRALTLQLTGTVGTVDGSRVVTCVVTSSVLVPRGAIRRIVNVCGLDAVRSSALLDNDGIEYDEQYNKKKGGEQQQLPVGARWAWLGVTAQEWTDLSKIGDDIGKALAARIISAGGEAILGELRSGAAPRAVTYGAAEIPLDR